MVRHEDVAGTHAAAHGTCDGVAPLRILAAGPAKLSANHRCRLQNSNIETKRRALTPLSAWRFCVLHLLQFNSFTCLHLPFGFALPCGLAPCSTFPACSSYIAAFRDAALEHFRTSINSASPRSQLAIGATPAPPPRSLPHPPLPLRCLPLPLVWVCALSKALATVIRHHYAKTLCTPPANTTVRKRSGCGLWCGFPLQLSAPPLARQTSPHAVTFLQPAPAHSAPTLLLYYTCYIYLTSHS